MTVFGKRKKKTFFRKITEDVLHKKRVVTLKKGKHGLKEKEGQIQGTSKGYSQGKNSQSWEQKDSALLEVTYREKMELVRVCMRRCDAWADGPHKNPTGSRSTTELNNKQYLHIHSTLRHWIPPM